MKYITVKLTEKELHAVINAIGNDFMDYEDDMGGEDKINVHHNRIAEINNRYLQRILDKLHKAKRLA